MAQRDVSAAARAIAGVYNPYDRYSAESLLQLLESYAARLSDDGMIIDIGSGTGAPARILQEISGQAVVACDVSVELLRENAGDSVELRVASDASALPFRTGIFSGAIFVESLHLMVNKLRAFEEALRVCRDGAHLAFLGVLQEDLRLQVYHRHFDEFRHMERSRHVSLDQIRTMASELGCSVESVENVVDEFVYADVDELHNFLARKPFFGLQQLDDEVFKGGLERFCLRVIHAHGRGPIVSTTKLSMVVLRAS